ncbi:phenylalanine--tRNA ligase subunit alpha [Aliarcobacter skirrowii]|uniref:Phenylalanine--tRNA ligase alpha subunit n=1 Tax=Aliarcobacter skirrowii CCUG 10374 TaxID=1032239 RepID=A0AAD0SJY0_9BACT|nr:phenylalanine--tRNA ligase subunit alpha [Aliarcobacter skirrowii]AXX84112.1 phenylalanyl-tRNA synthetase, alpha subunit [Aliarcobacter skirrowii CCUG 10374]KAB0621701.1 phenylalanine--tRNA ligase subunit alpha [Aliarcobacter skirrowii CCUG 10374]RXI26954.1 phenylalanine--tRNA ligase subunit alpha [Aliarcobacter skirrowii CCUG 10374]SUV14268.1 Phenylalanine--tRNA ligase alpha subunit [Aliarcobacter skirrowii]HAC71036.1 phenylalanine--tRNA ligase subunit alpha [Aliarcobacter skirrowii]
MELWIKKIESSKSIEELESVRVELLGKKGVLTLEFAKMKDIPNEEKKSFAQNLNLQKEQVTNALDSKKELLEFELLNKKLELEKIDVTKFNNTISSGSVHPVSETMNRIINYFLNLNFAVEEGPLVEDDFHNFQALNLPEYHPARDMADTFYNKDYTLLRTHTSPVQIRTMLSQKSPIRMIAPGTVFRRDFDITHTPMFHQIEGLVVDDADKISFANLKHVMVEFLQHMFGEVEVRFRPSYFPFTEPSAEVDISCVFCKGSGCRVCSQTGWLEVLGCGVVDQNVFDAVNYKDKSGYAFGLGIERFAMLIHNIGDLRSLFESDTRLLGQFK